VLRLIGGIRNAQGEKFQPNIVRVGKSDSINANVRRVTLDELVDQRLQARAPSQNSDANETALRAELNKVLEQRNAKGTEYDRSREAGDANASALAAELKDLNAKKNRIGAQLDEMREKRLALVRDRDISRRQMTDAILDEADVICATLSGSGHEQLAKMNVNFETVIIDEAAQSVELAALIPLKYGCQRCILVGDPNQLPPTVLSQAAAKFQYEESLFVRMQRNDPHSVYLLSIQYRMNPDISQFPSNKFYDGKLLDGPDMGSITRREWHTSPLFRPYCFFNVHGGEQEKGKRGISLLNRAEVSVSLQIYDRLRQDFGHIDFDGKVGIVTPYKEQLRELLRQFRSRYGDDITNSVDFNTIDGFQGQEKDIIILSCVRAAQDSGVGFLKDVRRINVALTRAKSSLFILGNKAALSNNEFWRDLIVDAEKRGKLIDCGPQIFVQNTVPTIKNRASAVRTGPKSSSSTPTGSKATSAGAASPVTGSAASGAKAKAHQAMAELIPLGPKSTISRKRAPFSADSDVEMPDATTGSESSDSESADVISISSVEEGEVMDIDTPPVSKRVTRKNSKSKSKDNTDEKGKKNKKRQQNEPNFPDLEISQPKKRKKSKDKDGKDKDGERKNSEKVFTSISWLTTSLLRYRPRMQSRRTGRQPRHPLLQPPRPSHRLRK
jgi:senataxin